VIDRVTMNTVNRRLLKEIKNLFVQQNQKPLLENDYIVVFDETNANTVHALVKAPYDSVYRHKFIRLDFAIPDNYPHSPPEVTFVNYEGVRIHPNMYENGKCCSTILNTWGDSKYEKWTSSMGIETVLLTFHSFLDNHPYTYEPGGRDDPSYTVYVQYQSWITCLLSYLRNETIESFVQYIHNYMLMNVDEIFTELVALRSMYPRSYYRTRCFEIDDYIIDYDAIISNLEMYYSYINYRDNVLANEDTAMDYEEFMSKDYVCNICYDTNNLDTVLTLSCTHKFHKECLKQHVDQNHCLCPMCRKELEDADKRTLDDVPVVQMPEWIINPLTKRRVKVGSRTYLYLQSRGVIE
jgi:ubiquitin-protein ligase